MSELPSVGTQAAHKHRIITMVNLISAHARGIEHDVIFVALMYEPHPVIVVYCAELKSPIENLSSELSTCSS